MFLIESVRLARVASKDFTDGAAGSDLSSLIGLILTIASLQGSSWMTRKEHVFQKSPAHEQNVLSCAT